MLPIVCVISKYQCGLNSQKYVKMYLKNEGVKLAGDKKNGRYYTPTEFAAYLCHGSHESEFTKPGISFTLRSLNTNIGLFT